MKTIIQGYEVECTMTEFMQYLQLKPEDTSPHPATPQLTTHRFVVDGVERGRSSPYRVIVEMDGKSVEARSIREAGRISGMPHSAFNLAKALREHHGHVSVNGIKFTMVTNEHLPANEEAETEVKTSVKINKPKGNRQLKFKLIYPNGDNRLISLRAFCQDNEIDYDKATYEIGKRGEYKVGGYTIIRK